MRLVASVRPSVRASVERAAVDIWDSALPIAAKSDNQHYQSKVIFSVSVISRLLPINAQMRLIGF